MGRGMVCSGGSNRQSPNRQIQTLSHVSSVNGCASQRKGWNITQLSFSGVMLLIHCHWEVITVHTVLYYWRPWDLKVA